MTGDGDRLDQIGRRWENRGAVAVSPGEVSWLIGALRDARAENERLTEFGIDLAVHEKVVTQLGATRTDCRALQEQLDSYVAESERLAAELAAERAKVDRVEAFLEAWEAPTRRRMHAHEWCELLGTALAGGEDR